MLKKKYTHIKYSVMPLGFGKKEEHKQQVSFTTDITEKDELEEIRKIASRFDAGEKVVVVAKQARMRPGGSIATPNVIFATDKRLIIRDPSAFGLRESIEDISYDKITSARLQKGVFSSSIVIRAPGFSTISEKRLNWIAFAKGSDEGEIEAISKDKADKIVEVIKKGMENAKKSSSFHPATSIVSSTLSLADELTKLAKLKETGIISEAEFLQMKQDLINKL